MVVYSCPRCGFTNNHKAKMRSHFRRKNICSPGCADIPIEECYEEVLGEKYEKSIKCVGNALECVGNALENDENALECVGNALECVGNALGCVDKNLYKCDGCKKIFKHPRYLKQHISRYNCKKKNIETEEVAELKSQISELKNENANLLKKVGNTTNNTTNNNTTINKGNTNNTNNTININLRAFGNEDLSYITEDFIKDLISHNLYSAIPKLLKEIHFNPDHKENMNTMIPSRKEALAKTFNGDRWDFTSKDIALEDMTDRAFNKLTEYGSGPKFEKFYDAYDDQDTGYLKKMKKQTEIMILNNQ